MIIYYKNIVHHNYRCKRIFNNSIIINGYNITRYFDLNNIYDSYLCDCDIYIYIYLYVVMLL